MATLTTKDADAQFSLQLYISTHTSINGLANEEMVDEMYNMILEHSRKYLDTNTAHDDVRALQPRFKEPVRKLTDSKGYSSENTCFNRGSEDHWVKDCPKKPSQPL